MTRHVQTILFLVAFFGLWFGTFYVLSNYCRNEIVLCCERDGTTYRRGMPFWWSYTTDHGEMDTTGWFPPVIDQRYTQFFDRRAQVFAVLVAALPSLLIANLLGIHMLHKQGWNRLRTPLRAAGIAAVAAVLIAAALRIFIGPGWLMAAPAFHDSVAGEIVTVVACAIWLACAAALAAVVSPSIRQRFATRRARRAALRDDDWPHETPPDWDEAKAPAQQEPMPQPPQNKAQA